MIFVFANDDRGLDVFPDESDAFAYCEGIDVEGGNYKFWDECGKPLEPKFTVPNDRFLVPGRYQLLPSEIGVDLVDSLGEVSYLEGRGIFLSIDDIKRYLKSK